ncbi:HIT domain-containing protein [Brevundimonas intermedia]|uniref:HIT domain-containing protein n=1 Tax=Brevundimonas intermedia TaxID=74315 RepID=A0ABQ5TAQ2_9CAUL|nr:HIT family protein [Brevundimonas intermedia]GLK49175.1 HIT domain-containing protein [Brevundimonas intermedia]
MGFQVASAFEAGSVAAAEWSLCHVRLQDDARFPWLILIPRVEGAVELEDLSVEHRAVLMEETVRAGALVRRLAGTWGAVEKLNVGAIGNVTAQLHVHVVGRRRDDGLWPDPVWGRGPAVPYAGEARARLLEAIGGG